MLTTHRSLFALALCLGSCLAAALGSCSSSGDDARTSSRVPEPIAADDAEPEPPPLPPLVPRLEECGLTFGDRTLEPSRVLRTWTPTFFAGELALSIDGDTVRATDVRSGAERWSAKSPLRRPFVWRASDDDAIYLAVAPGDDGPSGFEKPPRVYRLATKDGRWLESLVPPATDRGADSAEVIAAVLPSTARVIVLSSETVAGEWPPSRRQTAYRVTAFPRDGGAPLWSHRLEAAGTREYSGGYLRASTRPDYATDSIRSLNFLGDSVLVCAGPLEDLATFDLETGEPGWSIARIWEYRRGFIGPSVWSYTLNRGGRDTILDVDAERPAEKGVGDDNGETSAITAGPIVLEEDDDEDDYGEPRTFVAVARSSRAPWAGYLADCVVYEINSYGQATSTVTLPRLVNGWQVHVDDRGVVFGCPRDSIVRLAARTYEPWGGMLGRDDRLCRVEWYRDLTPQEPRAWLSADPATSQIAFTETHAFRSSGGGFVRAEGDGVYRFPLVRVDLKTGATKPLLLSVPFDGPLPRPESNYHGTEDSVHSHGAYRLGLTWLEIRGDALCVVLGTEEGASAVEFDLAALHGD